MCGIIVVIASFGAIALMMYSSIKTAFERDEKKDRERYTMYANRMADRMYRERIKNTQYKVTVPFTVKNESDIKWRADE